MYISQPCKTWLLSTFCASLLLLGGTSSKAQSTADAIDYLYVSPQGSDSWSGQSPVAADESGPFQTLAHAREAVSAMTESGLSRPVEIVFESETYGTQDFLSRWFAAAPEYPVIWHSDSSQSVLIYTRSIAEQNDALSAEDYANAAGDPITRYYVSTSGSDGWTGKYPSADGDNGPFQTLSRAQDAVIAFQSEHPRQPVEVVFENGDFPPDSMKIDSVKIAAGTARKSLKRPSTAAKAKPSAKPSAKGATSKIVIRHGGTPLALAASSRMVFAHYMVANRDYGGSVAGYERDIQDAQAAGIDGFVLNIGWWGGANYKTDTASLFQAAHALNSGFKLFFSIDIGDCDLTNPGFPASDMIDMMKTYGHDPAYFIYNGKSVLSTWGGNGKSPAQAVSFWQGKVLTPLKNAGTPIFFVPQLSAMYYASDWAAEYPNPSAGQIENTYNSWWGGIVDGLFNVTCGSPTASGSGSLGSLEAYAAICKGKGKFFMSSVTPQYWQAKIGNRGYSEFFGGEGLDTQWQSIINVQKPNWVELFTWNDFDESSYFSPIDDVCKYWPYVIGHQTLGYYKSHAGELALTKYYIQWYKTGVKPITANDNIYFFYRTQPKAMVATNDARGPVSFDSTAVQDVIYITSILPSPATLLVTSGSSQQTFQLPAGNSSIRVPFSVGSQTFTLSRKGKILLTQQGEDVVGSAAEYNFNYYTGSASD